MAGQKISERPALTGSIADKTKVIIPTSDLNAVGNAQNKTISLAKIAAELGGGGGGGIAIGDSVADADDSSILYVDGTGNLTQDTGFTRTSTGVTNISSTFSGETLQYQITDNLLGSGKNAILTQFTVPLGSLMDYTFSDDGDITSTKELSYPSATASTVSAFSYNNNSSAVTVGTNQGKLNITSQEVLLTKSTDLDAINEHIIGFKSAGGYAKLGDIYGGNGTSITIDDVNEQITIGNIKAFDDDAAAGTGGLTTGMVYMTTGSGSAPLNTPGILMIKQ